MTGFLASVKTLEEAQIALRGGADIIDLKNPDQGALGALPIDVIQDVVDQLWEKAILSATVGDLPADENVLCEAIQATADTGVDYVKVGFFSQEHIDCYLPAMRPFSARGIKLIAVCFGDVAFDFETTIQACKKAGLKGVMLDTAGKGSGSLRAHRNVMELEYFVNRARQLNMITGLAGSLKKEDIAPLLKIGSDYLGFRTALCQQSVRTSRIDEKAVRDVRRMIPIPQLSKLAPA